MPSAYPKVSTNPGHLVTVPVATPPSLALTPDSDSGDAPSPQHRSTSGTAAFIQRHESESASSGQQLERQRVIDAVNANDHEAITRLGQEIVNNGTVCRLSIAQLLSNAISGKKSLEVKLALAGLPGVDPGELLDTTARLMDTDFVWHLIEQGTPFTLRELLLFEAAVKSGDAKLALALLKHGAVPSHSKARRLAEMAINTNDEDFVRALLQKGMQPQKLFCEKLRDKATFDMRRFLERADRAYALYKGDGPWTKLDLIGKDYNFDAQRKMLEEEKSARDMKGDIELWERYPEPADGRDFKRAIMITGDDDTIAELTSTRRSDRSSYVHKGMGALKDIDQQLLSLYKTYPYRPEKNGTPFNYNGRARFDNNFKINCEPLSAGWVVARSQRNGKSPDDLFKDDNTIAHQLAELSVDTNTFSTMAANALQRHLKRDSQFGHFIAERFTAMNDKLMQATNAPRLEYMFISTAGHAMAAELKIRLKGVKQPHVLNVFDPNSTPSTMRVEASAPKEFEALDLDAVLPAKEFFSDRYHSVTKDRVCLLQIVSPQLSRNAKPDAAHRVKSLTSPPDVISKETLHTLLARGFSDDLLAILPKIREQLSQLPDEQSRIDFLDARNLTNNSGFYFAMRDRHIEGVAIYCDLVLNLNLSGNSKVKLLSGSSSTGVPAFLKAMAMGYLEEAKLFWNAVIDSDLTNNEKERLLTSTHHQFCAFLYPVTNGHTQVIRDFAKMLHLNRSLPPDAKHRLFTFTVNDITALGRKVPGEEAINAYQECAELLGFADDPTVKTIIDHWVERGGVRPKESTSAR